MTGSPSDLVSHLVMEFPANRATQCSMALPFHDIEVLYFIGKVTQRHYLLVICQSSMLISLAVLQP